MISWKVPISGNVMITTALPILPYDWIRHQGGDKLSPLRKSNDLLRRHIEKLQWGFGAPQF